MPKFRAFFSTSSQQKWVREGDHETCHTLGHTHYSVQLLKFLLKMGVGVEISRQTQKPIQNTHTPKTKQINKQNPQNKQKNPKTLFFASRSSKSMQYLAFVLQYCTVLPDASLFASTFLKLFVSCWSFVLLKHAKQLCLELLPHDYFMCGIAGSNYLQQGGYCKVHTSLGYHHVFMSHFHI